MDQTHYWGSINPNSIIIDRNKLSQWIKRLGIICKLIFKILATIDRSNCTWLGRINQPDFNKSSDDWLIAKIINKNELNCRVKLIHTQPTVNSYNQSYAKHRQYYLLQPFIPKNIYIYIYTHITRFKFQHLYI